MILIDATKSCVWKGEISELIFFQEENFPSSPLERLPQGHLRAKKNPHNCTNLLLQMGLHQAVISTEESLCRALLSHHR